jgi:hypothetical protein
LEIHEAIDHELSQIHRLTPSPSPARHLLSHARAIVVRIKEQQSRLAWISETTMIDRPAFDLVQTICFFELLDRRSYDQRENIQPRRNRDIVRQSRISSAGVL